MIVFLLLTGNMVLVCPAAASPLAKAQGMLRAGQYAKAEAAFGKLLRGPRRGPALLGLARTALETGRYAAAIRAARKAAKGKLRPAAMTLAAEALLQMGNLKEATSTLKKVTRGRPRLYRALVLLGRVLLLQGQKAEARAVFDQLYDDYDAGKIDKRDPEQLTYVGMACRYTDNFRDASDTFADAVQADPGHLEAHIQWAEISLEKYEAGYAEKHYASALKLNPHHAVALIGMARVKLTQATDVQAALKLLDRAEKTNPQSLDATVLRAEMLINGQRNLAAEALLTKALERNPRHLDALTMLGASFFLRDDPGSFERMRARVLALNPRHSSFFRTVVRLAVRHHRYAEAIGLSKRALKLDPQDWYSLADLGTNYLRQGEEALGLKHLRLAWKGDPFNVRTYNLLNLFEDVLAKQYTFIRSKHFRLRVHKEESALLQQTVVILLERAYGVYTKKYRFTPRGPIVVELFRDPNHYALRTVGVPGLGALGVCFGRVITAISPTYGRFNWGQVLWHELNHVFTIQLSRSRVPRWLTEGLAEMEPMLERPEWKREKGFEVYRALQAGRWKKVQELDSAFSQARNMQDMELAYFAGSRLTTFLVQRWGLPKVIEALRAFGKGQRVAKVLPDLTGMSLAELDRQFLAHQTRELARYVTNWYLDLSRYNELEPRRRAALAAPGNIEAQAELAVTLMTAGKVSQAVAQARKVLAQDSKNKLGLYVLARVALSRKGRPGAAELLSRLSAAGGDGYWLRLQLGRLTLERKDLKAARRHLERAKRLDPEAALPYALLAQAYEKAGKMNQAIKEYKSLVKINQHDFPTLLKLVKLLDRRKDLAGVRAFGERGYYIQPGSVTLHRLLARAYAAPAPTPRLKQAIRHLELALLCRPPRPADLHLELARLHLRSKKRGQAKTHLNKALKADPSLAGAKALRQQLFKD